MGCQEPTRSHRRARSDDTRYRRLRVLDAMDPHLTASNVAAPSMGGPCAQLPDVKRCNFATTSQQNPAITGSHQAPGTQALGA